MGMSAFWKLREEPSGSMDDFSMDRSFTFVVAVFVLLAVHAAPPARARTISLIEQVDIANGGSEIAYTRDRATVATQVMGTAPSIGVQLFALAADGSITAREFVSVAGEFGGAIASVSSVALDPLGRGFGVISVIPSANRTVSGVVVFFDYRAGSASVLKTLTVGFHPDHVVFSRDGTKVFVANEGEFTGNSVGEGGGGGNLDAPGSVSVIDLSSVTVIADIAGLDGSDVATSDFSASNLAAGVNLGSLRFNDQTFTAGHAYRHVEPETITEGDGVLYVTLQENNAIAEFALGGADEGKFTAIYSLGTLSQTIDASDKDGAGGSTAALVDDLVKGAPMPDIVTSYAVGSVRYLVTANEGAFRPDDGDRVRVSQFTGNDTGVVINRSNDAFGRLRVLRDLSDPDDDDLINEVVTPGTRSFSIWNADTGALVGDTGSFESLLLDLDPTLHNIDGEGGVGTFDLRSPEKGPEPEALAYGKIGAEHYVFVGMERQGAILMYEVGDPANPVFVTSINSVGEGLVSPRSILFISNLDSPTGNPLLLVGHGGGGRIAVYRLTDFTPVIIDSAPVITVPRKISASRKTRSVTLKGRASANTILVTVNGKAARGTANWSAKVSFPISKRRFKVVVEASSGSGLRSSLVVRIVRKR